MLSVSVHPIWFYFNLPLVTYEILLSCLHFLSQSWLMAFKVKIIGLHQCCFITLVHEECERLENEPKQKECITLVFEKVQSFTCVSLCIFITGASLTVHDIADTWCQKLMYTSSNWPPQLDISKQPTHVKAGPGQARRTGLRISKVNYQQSRGNETQKLKMGRGANCLWSLNGFIYKSLLQHLYFFPPLLKSMFNLKGVGGNAGAGGPLWIWNWALLPFRAPISGGARQFKGVRNTFEFKKKKTTAWEDNFFLNVDFFVNGYMMSPPKS